MPITYRFNLDNMDWAEMKRSLAADDFDNGRTPAQLEKSFRNSHSASIAYCDGHIVGTARVLSDGVCNAYLLDVWTKRQFRRQGIATRMVESLLTPLRGQHVYLQSDDDTVDFYAKLGFKPHPSGMARVIGEWLSDA
jgi:predicted GNAT family acetyltransferase